MHYVDYCSVIYTRASFIFNWKSTNHDYMCTSVHKTIQLNMHVSAILLNVQQ